MKSILLLILLATMVASCSDCRGGGERRSIPMPAGTPKRPTGVGALSVQPGGTPFTRDDVEAYVHEHNLPGNLGPKEALRVDALEFVSSVEVSKRLGGVSTGLGDADMVAFATISGGLVFSSPPPERKQARFERGYAAFDPGTGNLLMVGTLGEANRE